MAARVKRIWALRALWDAVRGATRPGAPSAGARLAAVPRMVRMTLSGRYRDLDRGRLALMAMALAYVLSPIDLMPEVLLTVFGLGDDALVASWLVGALLVESEAFLRWEAGQPGTIVTDPISSRSVR